MFTIIKHTFIESFNKRMALALMIVSVLTVVSVLWFFRFQTLPNGKLVVESGGQTQTATAFVHQMSQANLQLTSGLWLFLSLFALAPLLTSYLDKGMTEVLFTKGLPRWQIAVGRLVGCMALYTASLVLIDLLPALYYWYRTGISPQLFLEGVLLLWLSFLSLAALMALMGTVQRGSAVAIAVAFVQVTISGILFQRKELYDVLKTPWLEKMLELCYYVLPKNSDLNAMASRHLQIGAAFHWMPIWSTLLFIAGTIAGMLYLLNRKPL